MSVPSTPAQRKALRARAHALKPVVLVGDAGLSAALLAEAASALEHHELIKVRLPPLGRAQREEMARQLCDALGAQDVQGIGRVRVIYRERPQSEAPVRRAARAKKTPSRQR